MIMNCKFISATKMVLLYCGITAVGKVNLTNTTLRLKWGIGRIISEVKSTPIVLPFWHSGQYLYTVCVRVVLLVAC